MGRQYPNIFRMTRRQEFYTVVVFLFIMAFCLSCSLKGGRRDNEKLYEIRTTGSRNRIWEADIRNGEKLYACYKKLSKEVFDL